MRNLFVRAVTPHRNARLKSAAQTRRIVRSQLFLKNAHHPVVDRPRPDGVHADVRRTELQCGGFDETVNGMLGRTPSAQLLSGDMLEKLLASEGAVHRWKPDVCSAVAKQTASAADDVLSRLEFGDLKRSRRIRAAALVEVPLALPLFA